MVTRRVEDLADEERAPTRSEPLDEITAAVGDPPRPKRGSGGPPFASFTEVVYKELSKKGALDW